MLVVKIATIVSSMELSFRSIDLFSACLSKLVELCSTCAGEKYQVPREIS